MKQMFYLVLLINISTVYCAYKSSAPQYKSACEFKPSQGAKVFGYQIYSANCTPQQNPFQQCTPNGSCLYTPPLKGGTLYNAACFGKQQPCIRK